MQPPFTNDEDISSVIFVGRTHQDRLHHAVRLDRIRQLFQRIIVLDMPRLKRIPVNVRDRKIGYKVPGNPPLSRSTNINATAGNLTGGSQPRLHVGCSLQGASRARLSGRAKLGFLAVTLIRNGINVIRDPEPAPLTGIAGTVSSDACPTRQGRRSSYLALVIPNSLTAVIPNSLSIDIPNSLTVVIPSEARNLMWRGRSRPRAGSGNTATFRFSSRTRSGYRRNHRCCRHRPRMRSSLRRRSRRCHHARARE